MMHFIILEEEFQSPDSFWSHWLP